MGVMYPVIDWQMNQSMNYDREAEFFGMAFSEPTHTVELKLAGRVPNLMRADTAEMRVDADAILVIHRAGPEPLYFRLAIRDVTWSMTGQGEGYTTVQANCTQVE